MKGLPLALLVLVSSCCQLREITEVSDHDPGATPDAGFTLDAGLVLDAGAAPDSGSILDAGLVPDAGEPDGGCTPTSSQTVYAHTSSQLYIVDPGTWTTRLVGSFGFGDMTDLAVSPDNEIYTVSNDTLYLVDFSTAAATELMGLGGSYDFTGLTFLPDSRLMAVDASGLVVIIDPKAQTVTQIGSFGPGLGCSGDVVAVADGTIYGTSPSYQSGGDLLVRVDPQTGAAAVIGATGISQVWGLGFYGGTVIAFSETGAVARIDPATGAGTVYADAGVEFWGAGVSPLVVKICP